MAEYDRQLIVKFLTGRHGDGAVSRNAWKLKQKDDGIKTHTAQIPRGRAGWRGKILDGPAEKHLRAELAKLTPNSRLYLEGHGYWKTQKLGDWGPEEVADMLVGYGLTEVKMISLAACELAKARKHDDHQVVETAVANSMNSFAQKFHYFLGFKYRIFSPVQARLRCVAVTPEGTKVTTRSGHYYRHQPRSKVRFDWGTSGQTIAYVDYDEPEVLYA